MISAASRSIAVLVLLAVVAAHGSDAALGASFTVNSTADTIDANPGDGACADANGACTLRAAVLEANALPGADAISVPAGTYLLGERLGPTGDISITGASPVSTKLSGSLSTGQPGGGLEVPIGASVAISSLSIVNTLEYDGAAVRNNGTLTLSSVEIRGNTAGFGTDGGGVYNYGTVRISDSTIALNNASVGGGIFNRGTLSVTNSTLSGNSAVYSGGGLWHEYGQASLVNITAVANLAGSGNGIAGFGAITIRNAALGQNQSGGDCGPIVSLGHNISSDASCNLTGPGDMNGVDPKVGPLADNGGPTLTHALLVGSPAINAGDNNGCPSTDQRGVARPQQGTCDIGAYEYAPPATPAPTPKPAVFTASPTPAPTSAPGSPTATAEPSPSPTAKLSPTAKPSASRTPQRSPTPASTPFASGSDDSGGSTALTIGLTLAGLAAASAGGGGAYYVWQRRGTGGPPFRRP